MTTVTGQLITLTAAAVQTETEPALDAMVILRLDGSAEDRLTDLIALRARLSVPGARLSLEMVDDDAETIAPALS
jgi:predicted negative regulator of RcsB-dependent stress response